MNKRRRNDENVVTDQETADFLDRHEKLYGDIQLSCYLEKLPNLITDLKSLNLDTTSPRSLCLSLLNHIKSIVFKFRRDIIFTNEYGVEGQEILDSYSGTYNYNREYYKEKYGSANFVNIYTWIMIIGDDDDDSSKFFDISRESFDKYFSYLNNIISTTYGINFKVYIDADSDYAITFVIIDK